MMSTTPLLHVHHNPFCDECARDTKKIECEKRVWSESDSTLIGRVEVISDQLLPQLVTGIVSAAFFSLASDKSNDRTDIAQLVVGWTC